MIKKLHALESNPERGEKLKYSDFWQLRMGDYRAVYEKEVGIQKSKFLNTMAGISVECMGALRMHGQEYKG